MAVLYLPAIRRTRLDTAIKNKRPTFPPAIKKNLTAFEVWFHLKSHLPPWKSSRRSRVHPKLFTLSNPAYIVSERTTKSWITPNTWQHKSADHWGSLKGTADFSIYFLWVIFLRRIMEYYGCGFWKEIHARWCKCGGGSLSEKSVCFRVAISYEHVWFVTYRHLLQEERDRTMAIRSMWSCGLDAIIRYKVTL